MASRAFSGGGRWGASGLSTCTANFVKSREIDVATRVIVVLIAPRVAPGGGRGGCRVVFGMGGCIVKGKAGRQIGSTGGYGSRSAVEFRGPGLGSGQADGARTPQPPDSHARAHARARTSGLAFTSVCPRLQ